MLRRVAFGGRAHQHLPRVGDLALARMEIVEQGVHALLKVLGLLGGFVEMAAQLRVLVGRQLRFMFEPLQFIFRRIHRQRSGAQGIFPISERLPRLVEFRSASFQFVSGRR
ncbi:MAG: hypothetical protein WCF18_08930 [Chthoniobacteraceae bacterium]